MPARGAACPNRRRLDDASDETVIEAIGTYLPPWGSSSSREPGPDEDTVTLAVAAGLQMTRRATASVRRVVFVTREPPLLEGDNASALLAGLGLAADVEVREQLGGAPAALEAVADAEPGTLVVGSDITGGAGSAAVLCSIQGADVTTVSRTNRSLPVTTRDASGAVADYADPRLLRELGVGVSLERAGVHGKVGAVAGITGKDAAALCDGDPPALPTVGASAPLFALAAVAERLRGARILAVEQATVLVADLQSGSIDVARDEATAMPAPTGCFTPGSDIAISLAAYERAFDAKLGLIAARCTTCGTLSYPHRYRCLGCGSEAPTEPVDLPRDAEVYTAATIHVPVPGLMTPYTVVVAELGDTEVRLLVQLTGAPAGTVGIGDRGRLVFRRVATRSGVPDYGYGFLPNDRVEVAA